MEYRVYQEESIQATVQDYEQYGSDGSGLLYLATGTGKTVIAAEISKRIGGPILFLVHRDELATQAIAKYQAVWKGVDIGLVKAKSNELGRTVTVASVQTAKSEKRMEELFSAQDYKMIIADEARHYASPSFENVLLRHKAYRLGLDATPLRSDDVGLSHLFSKILYKYTIIDGIRDGYLCDLQARGINIGVNLDGVKVTAGDFAANAISDVMSHESVLEIVYSKWKEYASDRKTVVFCCDINHAKMTAEYFSRNGVIADWISGEMDTDTRRSTLKRFSRGQTQVLANCMILTEGWDEPSVDCVVMARPTKSQSLYIQCVGRGLRIYPNKENCLLLDIVANTEKHKLMQVTDLTGIPYPDMQAKSDGPGMDKLLRSIKDVIVCKDEAIDLYRKQPPTFNWISTKGGVLGIQIGFNHYIVIRSVEDGYEAYNCYLKGWQYTEAKLISSPIVDLCISMAEEEALRIDARSGKNTLQHYRKDKEFKADKPTSKQVEILRKYDIPVPDTAEQASKLISRQFFDFFLQSSVTLADPQDRARVKAAKYADALNCSITLDQIEHLKEIEYQKINKFYIGGQKNYGWRRA